MMSYKFEWLMICFDSVQEFSLTRKDRLQAEVEKKVLKKKKKEFRQKVIKGTTYRVIKIF